MGVCVGDAPIIYFIYIADRLSGRLPSLQKSPLSPLVIARMITEAGFPPGAVQFVNGFGPTVTTLASHMDIGKVSFTGSFVQENRL